MMKRLLAFAMIATTSLSAAEPIRIGMIGLDTSHAPAFTKLLNERSDAQVVAAVAESSPDIESSHTRVSGFTATLRDDFGVKIVATIEEMLPLVDAVMVESVDGRPHLRQATAAIEAGKPVFIDKPMAASLADVRAIFALAEKHGVPVWSSSNLRFHSGVVAASHDASIGEQTAVISYGPAKIDPTHPDLMWYGIHPVEALFTVMGPGCVQVQRTFSEGTDVVTGLWSDGRVGTLIGLRKGKAVYGVKVFGTKGVAEHSAGGAYPEQIEAIVEAFKTGEVPVTPAQTIEIFAFMEAADLSKAQDGAPISLEALLEN